MVDAEKLLKSLDVYDNYRPSALDYQRFDDGSLHMIPFQFELEFIWYNKALLQKAGVSAPKSLDDIPAMCTALRDAGITPIAIDGQDQWPLERYVAYQPFREAGPDFIQKLKKGEAKFSDPAGKKTVEWLASLGQGQVLPGRILLTGLLRRAEPVHLRPGSDVQHRHLGAAQPGNRQAESCSAG